MLIEEVIVSILAKNNGVHINDITLINTYDHLNECQIGVKYNIRGKIYTRLTSIYLGVYQLELRKFKLKKLLCSPQKNKNI